MHQFQLTVEDCDKQVSDSHLEEISRSCCVKWRSLPSHLELPKVVSADIDREHIGEEEKRNSFFSTWKLMKGSYATYRKLIYALLKIECRDDAGKVCKLLKKFVSAHQHQPNFSTSLKSEPSQPTSDTGS